MPFPTPATSHLILQAPPGSDLFWSAIFIIETVSVTMLTAEFFYLTFRSFIAPRNVGYLKHFAAMTATTILFFAIELLLFQIW